MKDGPILINFLMEIMLGIGEKLVAILKIEIVDLYEELIWLSLASFQLVGLLPLQALLWKQLMPMSVG
jgi:hypothetical protein